MADKKPSIGIDVTALRKLRLYIDLADGEISGLGVVKTRGERLVVEDVFLLKQKCSTGSTELADEDVHAFLLEMIEAGVDPAAVKMWWHSHAGMGTFWSSTDDETAGKFDNDWMICVVGNKKGEFLCRLDLYSPIRCTVDDIPIVVLQAEDAALIEQVKAEIAEKVEKSYTYKWKSSKAGNTPKGKGKTVVYGGWAEGRVWVSGKGWVDVEEEAYENKAGENLLKGESAGAADVDMDSWGHYYSGY